MRICTAHGIKTSGRISASFRENSRKIPNKFFTEIQGSVKAGLAIFCLELVDEYDFMASIIIGEGSVDK